MLRDWSEVKEICDKATPGPWTEGYVGGVTGPTAGKLVFLDAENIRYSVISKGVSVIGITLAEDFLSRGDDAQFISTARTALPEAIAEIEQLRQEKAELVEALKEYNSLYNLSDMWLSFEPVSHVFANAIPINAVQQKLLDLLAKHEGGEPNAKP